CIFALVSFFRRSIEDVPMGIASLDTLISKSAEPPSRIAFGATKLVTVPMRPLRTATRVVCRPGVCSGICSSPPPRLGRGRNRGKQQKSKGEDSWSCHSTLHNGAGSARTLIGRFGELLGFVRFRQRFVR